MEEDNKTLEENVSVNEQPEESFTVKVSVNKPIVAEGVQPMVNDIMPPPQPAVTIENSEASEEVTTETQPAEPIEVASNDVVAAPPEQEPSTEEQQAVEQVGESGDDTVTPDMTEEISNTEESVEIKNEPVAVASLQQAVVGVAASQMKGSHPTRNNKKLAAFVTVVVTLLLAGTAVYVYMSANSNTENSNNSDTAEEPTNSQEIESATPATVEEADAASQEVEQAVNALDEATDFSEEDLSDTTLNL